MLRILITQVVAGSIEGVQLSQLGIGLTYDVNAAVGRHLLSRGAAVPVDPTLPAIVYPMPSAFEIRSHHGRTRAEAADN